MRSSSMTNVMCAEGQIPPPAASGPWIALKQKLSLRRSSASSSSSRSTNKSLELDLDQLSSCETLSLSRSASSASFSCSPSISPIHGSPVHGVNLFSASEKPCSPMHSVEEAGVEASASTRRPISPPPLSSEQEQSWTTEELHSPPLAQRRTSSANSSSSSHSRFFFSLFRHSSESHSEGDERAKEQEQDEHEHEHAEVAGLRSILRSRVDVLSLSAEDRLRFVAGRPRKGHGFGSSFKRLLSGGKGKGASAEEGKAREVRSVRFEKRVLLWEYPQEAPDDDYVCE
mmetsp:Transcript_56870/g.133341  ORF Transcript_56870/g.133341 Transcript_56870/m.133341 type:complete len:286 (-) Transcript_56870:154-1011(-)